MEKKKILGLVFAFLVLLAGGYLWRMKSPQPLVPLPKVGSPTATPFPPPGWKSYRHPDFGYSLFYPQEWTVREQGPVNNRVLDVTSWVVSSEGVRIPAVQIKVSSLPYGEEISKRNIRESGFTSKGRLGEKVLIDGVEGVKVVGQAEGKEKTISLFLPGENQTFVLLGLPEVFSDQDQTALIDKVFSTFKFP